MMRLLSMLIILFGLSLVSVYSNAKQKKPNIIFLLTDDQASWAVGYNNPEFLTPEINKLAEQGIRFNRHYNTTAICMASRANIMTGKYEFKTGTNFMHGSMTHELFADSYPVLLKQAGYFTGFVGKFGFETPPQNSKNLPKGYEDLPVDQFDVWYGGKKQTSFTTKKNFYLKKFAQKYPHATLANGAAAIDFIEQASEKNKPFMLSVSFKAPHAPVKPDPQFDHLFDNRTYSQPVNYWRDKGKHISYQAKLGRQYLTEDAFGFEPKSFNWRMAKYNQQVYGVDVAISNIRAKLKELKLDDNTVIIFSSDNGYFNGNHGFSRKVLPYEEAVKAPMIIFDPRVKNIANKHINQITANIDIAATILTLAGLASPSEIDGKDLSAYFENERTVNHQYLPLINVWGSAPAQGLAIVTDKFKYIYWFYGEGMSPREELYDLVNDEAEMNNLVGNSLFINQLEQMREYYDEQVTLWKKHSVKFNGYQQYAVLFDRSLNWQQKRELIDPKFVDAYHELIAPYHQNKTQFIDTYGIEPTH